MRLLVCLTLVLLSSQLISQPEDSFKTKRFNRSNLYAKGDYELHLFNNYYTQLDKSTPGSDYDSRYSFFTMIGQVILGVSSKVNIGFDINFRSVNQNTLNKEGTFRALSFKNQGFTNENGQNSGYSRIGISTAGPKIQYQIFPALGSFSVLHTLLIPIGSDLGGNDETGYLDWGSPVLMNQVFFDKNLGSNWSIFAETGFFIENINNSLINKKDGFYQISIPSTAIISYYPVQKLTVFGLLSYAGRWENSVTNESVNTNYNPYYQFGIGSKYWISKKIEAEFIFTTFEDQTPDRTATTFNLGFRYFSNR